MTKRLIRVVTAMAWLLGLAGCATSPSTFRIVEIGAGHGKAIQWLLPPGVDTWRTGGRDDSTPSSGFRIDIPLRDSACPYFAKFPIAEPSSGGLQGEIAPMSGGAVLRLKSSGALLDHTSLRAAWAAWWDKARTDWPGKCLAGVRSSIEAMLMERRPLPLSEVLKQHYGFDGYSRTVVIRPGTSVCVADVPYRSGIVPGAMFSAAGETCATAVSDDQGGANFWPAINLYNKLTSLDVEGRKVHTISSWAEIPKQDGYVFLLRYPKTMPHNPALAAKAEDADYPLLISVNAANDGAVNRARQCVDDGANTKQVTAFCGSDGFNAPSCGQPLPAGSPLAVSPPRCFRFGERGVPTPYITVLLNGAPVNVPLGTTLGGAIERLSPPRRLGDQHVEQAKPAAVARARVTRMFEGRPIVVDLSGADASALDFLLLPGDNISW